MITSKGNKLPDKSKDKQLFDNTFNTENIPEFDKWYSSATIPTYRQYDYACIREQYFNYYTDKDNTLRDKYKTVEAFLFRKTIKTRIEQCSKDKDKKLQKSLDNKTSMDNINTSEIQSYKNLQNIFGYDDKSKNTTSLDAIPDKYFEKHNGF